MLWNAFDTFIGVSFHIFEMLWKVVKRESQVRGFAQHIKNMGKASDMDVCNYFIHNHKVGVFIASLEML